MQDEREWRCGCGVLLGVERGGHVHVRYKAAQYVVNGTVVATCRRCGKTSTARADPAARTCAAVSE